MSTQPVHATSQQQSQISVGNLFSTSFDAIDWDNEAEELNNHGANDNQSGPSEALIPVAESALIDRSTNSGPTNSESFPNSGPTNSESFPNLPLPESSRAGKARKTPFQDMSEMMMEGFRDLAEKVAEQTGYQPQECMMAALKDVQKSSNSRPITQYAAELALARDSMGEPLRVLSSSIRARMSL